MSRVAVAVDKFRRGFDGTGREQADAYEVVELHDALTRTYATDAHLVTYVVAGAARQCRIKKDGLPHFPGTVETTALFADVDNPAHGEWTEALREKLAHQMATLDVLATAGVYLTAHGFRVVQPLVEAIPVLRAEAYLKRWLMSLSEAGIDVDWKCPDWTRHFRLPNVRRSGRVYQSPLIALEKMTPIALAPPPESELEAASMAEPRAPRPIPVIAWSHTVPEPWHARVERLAAAVREESEDWHGLFLAIAGALIARGVPHEQVPVINRAISIATGADTRTEDRERGARSTVERHLGGSRMTGFSSLRRQWPRVADAVDAIFARGAEARIRACAAAGPTSPIRPLAETTSALEDAIRNAPDGLTLISAECGLGKTRAIRRIAQERAGKGYASEHATGKRAPVQSKTAISVDKNTLAIQITRDLRADGAEVRRVFGPLSVLREDGTPECRFAESARPLVEGGQAMQWELCKGRGGQRCEFYEECLARDGVDGPANARITVGTHALLSQLDAAAGSTGLLVIDEPPALLETTAITVSMFDTALRALPWFVTSYGDAMRPALRALRAWVAEIAVLEEAVSPVAALRAAEGHVSSAELAHACRAARVTAGDDAVEALVACAHGAQPPDHVGKAPPIQRAHIFAARRAVAFATELGTASKVLRAIQDALTSDGAISVRVEELGNERTLLLTSARADLTAAVKRQGAVVVADANAALHVPVLAKVVGYEPRLHRFTAADGAPIERRLFRARAATRRGWLCQGRVIVHAGVEAALATVIAWAQEDPAARELAIITFRALEVALSASLHPQDEAAETAWKDAGQRPADLPRVRERLAPVLARWPGRIVLAHYGGVRGLDGMKDVDCLATLGDPWPNLGQVRHDIAFLGLEESYEARLDALCRAELEQAHGRLRAVHRRRPGRALHVGNVLPGGSGWSSSTVEIRRARSGPAKQVPAMSNNELVPIVARLGGIRATARALGCAHTTIGRYVNGESAVPAAMAVELRRLGVGESAAE